MYYYKLVSGQLSAFHPSGVGIYYKYQLRLGRQRQVWWFILLADEREVFRLNCEIS